MDREGAAVGVGVADGDAVMDGVLAPLLAAWLLVQLWAAPSQGPITTAPGMTTTAPGMATTAPGMAVAGAVITVVYTAIIDAAFVPDVSSLTLTH